MAPQAANFKASNTLVDESNFHLTEVREKPKF